MVQKSNSIFYRSWFMALCCLGIFPQFNKVFIAFSSLLQFEAFDQMLFPLRYIEPYVPVVIRFVWEAFFALVSLIALLILSKSTGKTLKTKDLSCVIMVAAALIFFSVQKLKPQLDFLDSRILEVMVLSLDLISGVTVILYLINFFSGLKIRPTLSNLIMVFGLMWIVVRSTNFNLIVVYGYFLIIVSIVGVILLGVYFFRTTLIRIPNRMLRGVCASTMVYGVTGVLGIIDYLALTIVGIPIFATLIGTTMPFSNTQVVVGPSFSYIISIPGKGDDGKASIKFMPEYFFGSAYSSQELVHPHSH